MDGQARAAVLGRRVTGQPGKGVVLLQHKSVKEKQFCYIQHAFAIIKLNYITSQTRRGTLPENIRGLIGVQRVRVFAVQKFIRLH